MNLFENVLPENADCAYGRYSVSFPALYWWYQDNMRVNASQIDANGTTTDYMGYFVREENLDQNLLL